MIGQVFQGQPTVPLLLAGSKDSGGSRMNGETETAEPGQSKTWAAVAAQVPASTSATACARSPRLRGGYDGCRRALGRPTPVGQIPRRVFLRWRATCVHIKHRSMTGLRRRREPSGSAGTTTIWRATAARIHGILLRGGRPGRGERFFGHRFPAPPAIPGGAAAHRCARHRRPARRAPWVQATERLIALLFGP